jgi:hypothetical protein
MNNKKIQVNNEGLEELFDELLKGLKEDLDEANINVDVYKTLVLNTPAGKEQYGSFLNEALKIKGGARDRMLKFLNLFKDRVKSKEVIDQIKRTEGSAGIPPEKIMEALDKVEKQKEQDSLSE